MLTAARWWAGRFGVCTTADLVIAALKMTSLTREPESVIHHSDQGCRHTSVAFGKRYKETGVRPSTGTAGDTYDNALAESFFAALECELTDRRIWKTHTGARLAIFTWIEARYNPHRRHSSPGQISPVNFEKLHVQRKEEAKTQNQQSVWIS